MISIASYMSTASTATNTCSNNLSEQKYNGQILSEKSENKSNLFLKDKNNEELDVDTYFNQNFSPTLNNIAYNFMISTDNNTLTESSNESKVINHPIIKQSINHTEPALPNSNLKKMKSLFKNEKESKTLSKSNECKENVSMPKSQSNDVSLNPFGEEITDSSNPFLNDDSSETTTIEVDNNFNIKLSSKNNEINENDSSNKTTKDLLDWCKDIINCSKLLNHNLLNNLEVNDFSGSWTNGLAFCVIIHHFRPNLM